MRVRVSPGALRVKEYELYREVTGEFSEFSNTDQQRLSLLMTLAQGVEYQYKHAASLYKGGRLLAAGVNSTRWNDEWTIDVGVPGKRKPTRHAEESVLRRVGPQGAEGAVLYVARVTRGGRIGMSRPCLKCHQLLLGSGVKKVVFTSDQDIFVRELERNSCPSLAR